MNLKANVEVLHHRGNYLVRRQRLNLGQATPWHRDPYHRVTVVLNGDLLNIEFRDGGETHLSAHIHRTVDAVAWLRPIHLAYRYPPRLFKEVVTFFLDRSDAVPQPEEG